MCDVDQTFSLVVVDFDGIQNQSEIYKEDEAY